MGNMVCPDADLQPLASIARDFCPFPDYNPNPLLLNMLYHNSSQHLSDHYRDVQNSLSPSQLADFTRSLRTTFGREGIVTMGGVGVVALSLAVLFDTLARQVKNQFVPESGPIPGLFLKVEGGKHHPYILLASDYLRLVPYIANNPTRMSEETEGYYRKMLECRKASDASSQIEVVHDKQFLNLLWATHVEQGLYHHLIRLTNSSSAERIKVSVNDQVINDKRKKSSVENDMIYSFNCDVEEASKRFLQEVEKDEQTKVKMGHCKLNDSNSAPVISGIAELLMFNGIFTQQFNQFDEKTITQIEGFNLKANALVPF